MQSIPKESLLIVGNLLSSSVGNRAIGEEMAVRLAARGWTVRAVSTLRPKLPRLADMLRTCWDARHQYRVAVVDVFAGQAFLWAEAVSSVLARLRKPYVLVLRGGALPRFAARWPWRVRRLLARAPVVVAPSPYLAGEMAAFRGDIRLVPNAIEVAAYPFVPRRAPRPRLVWLRSFHEVYNPSLAPEVLALVRRERPEATLLMVGPDKGDGSLERTREAAGRLGVPVEFAGAVPKSEIAAWIHQGDVFLNTTNVDNTPVSVIEAMACGACVVTTNVGGIPYLLEDGRDALLVAPRDAAAMAEAVLAILNTPGLGERLSAAARAKAETFDWAAVLDRWEALLCGTGEPGRRRSAAAKRSCPD